MVEENRFLHEWHDAARVRDLVAGIPRPVQQLILELARQPLCLAAGELEWGVLGTAAFAPPGQVIAAQRSRVVLQLD
jgi:hypothetical protein